jgi:hypothetical protein
MDCEKTIPEVLSQYSFTGKLVSVARYGSGHINDTFLAVYDNGGRVKRYIVQRINTAVFKNPDQLMQNIHRVTEFLKCRIRQDGGDPVRETLHIVPDAKNAIYYEDSSGGFWRVYDFIENATSYDKAQTPEQFYEAAFAFGVFQKRLSEFDAASLFVTIPDFHHTPHRFAAFQKAVQADTAGRVHSVQKEIDFFRSHEKDMELCQNMLDSGELPLRVTHNDTKLNNILIDDVSGKGVCVIDLDTVMSGLAVFDFGDAIRFGANTAAEDEVDLEKVMLDLRLFEAFTSGFLAGCGGSLTSAEIDMLPAGAKIMTLECGMRFLTDYLQGDVYFKVHHDRHNLDRARTQIKLVAEMEKQWYTLTEIVKLLQEKSYSK